MDKESVPDESKDMTAWAAEVVRLRVPEVIDKYLVSSICCAVCGSGEREDVLLLCDGCSEAIHVFCLSPPLEQVPQHDWLCPACMDYDIIDSSDSNDDANNNSNNNVVSKPQSVAVMRRCLVVDKDKPCESCNVNMSVMFVIDAREAAPGLKERVRFVRNRIQRVQFCLEAGIVPKVNVSGKRLCANCSERDVEAAYKAQFSAWEKFQVKNSFFLKKIVFDKQKQKRILNKKMFRNVKNYRRSERIFLVLAETCCWRIVWS
jgi:hypothetical protein